MSIVARFRLLCTLVMPLPGVAAAQPNPLAVERVWTQDAGGNTKTSFAPGETMGFMAKLKNPYSGALLGEEVPLNLV